MFTLLTVAEQKISRKKNKEYCNILAGIFSPYMYSSYLWRTSTKTTLQEH